MKTFNVVSDLLSVYKDAQDYMYVTKRDPTRVASIRPSQLPYCPVAQFLSLARLGLNQTTEIGTAFFTEIGTTVHDVVQRFVGTTGRFLADWECKNCRKWKRFTHEHECCDMQMKYHEVKINHNGIVGHIDGIFRDKNGNYWILDFKTASIKGLQYKQKSPGRVYKEQVMAYALKLWEQYGIKVKGVLLMFIAREDYKQVSVWKKEINDDDLEKTAKRLRKYKRMHKEVMSAVTTQEVIALARYGKCKNEWCKECGKDDIEDLLLRARKVAKTAKRLPLSNLIK